MKELTNFEKEMLVEFSRVTFDMIPETEEEFEMIKEEYDHYNFLLYVGME